MTRSSLISMPDNCIVAAYLQVSSKYHSSISINTKINFLGK